MSGHLAPTWLDTVLSYRENHRDPVVADSSPPPKRRRLQPSTPGSPQATTDNGTPVASGLKRPAQHLPETHEEPQTTDSNDREQTAPRVSTSPFPTSPNEDSESDETRSIDSVEEESFGVKKRKLEKLNPLVPSLETLLKEIRQFSDGVGILPTSVRRRFNKLDDEDMAWARQGSKSNKYYSQKRQVLGEVVSSEELRKLVAKNIDCRASWSPEASRDVAVNSRVLDLAFDRADGYLSLSSSLWISEAYLTSQYDKARDSSRGKANFCIFIDDLSERQLADIVRLRESPAENGINHTDFGSLYSCPLALSINTTGHRLQLGMWEAARWARLRDLLQACPTGASGMYPKPNLPEFLPAIVVENENWNLVVTTYEEEKTTIWHHIKMGSTSSVQGIYQIIACLHLLRQWVEDVFWPWLSDILLRSRPARSSVANSYYCADEAYGRG